MNPVRISAKATAASDVNAMFVTAIFFGLPEIRNALKLGNFTLNQIPVEFGLGLSSTGTAVRVVESTLKQKPVLRLVHKQLARRLAVVERFGVVRVGGSEDDKSHVVASITGTSAVVVAIENVKGMTRNHRRTAIISFRIRHCEKVTRVNRHKQLEVYFLAGKLVGKLGEKMLKLTARAQISDAERIANCLENPAPFFTRSVGLRRELIDSVDIVISFVIGAGEKADGAFNQSDFVAVGVQFGGVENGVCEVVNEAVIGVVRLGAVNDDSLQIFVPALRLAEEFAQSTFAVDRISSETFDEFFRNVFINIVGIGMAEIIFKSRPNVVASEFLEFVHFEDLQK